MLVPWFMVVGMIAAAAGWHVLTPRLVHLVQDGIDSDPDRSQHVFLRTVRLTRAVIWVASLGACLIVLAIKGWL